MLANERFREENVTSWTKFLDWYHAFFERDRTGEHRWIFRGEEREFPSMSTTLEREADRGGIPLEEVLKREGRLLNEFKRRLHHYGGELPHPGDTAEWLSLMRHYGAPSRLLDWSYSPFVGLFFATEKGEESDEWTSVLWVMDSEPYTSRHVIERLPESSVKACFHDHRQRFGFTPEPTKEPMAKVLQYLIDRPKREMLVINPFRLSDRASVQQGIHLMVGDVTRRLEDNLAAQPQQVDGLLRISLRMNHGTRKEFLLHLRRMSIDRATLFPGVQGFAESLATRMVIPETLSY